MSQRSHNMTNDAIVLQTEDKDTTLQKLDRIEDSYQNSTKLFTEFLRYNNLNFSSDNIEKYVAYLKRKYRSANSFNFHISALRNRIKFTFKRSPERLNHLKILQLEDFLKTKVKKIKIQAVPVDSDRLLTIQEARDFILFLPEHLSLLAQFLFSTGLRISEALNITYEDLTRINGYYTIKIIGKGIKQREVKLSTLLVEKILNHFQGSTYLFEKNEKRLNRNSITNLFVYYGEKFGKHVTSHMWRHTFSNYYLSQNPSKLKALSSYLGHSTTTITTQYYLHQSVSIEEVPTL